MAEFFLSPLLPMLRDKAEAIIKDKLTKLLFSDAKHDVEELRDRLSLVDGLLSGAEIKQASNEGLRRWLSTLQNLAYDADDLLDAFTYELTRRQTPDKITHKVRDFFSLSHNPFLFDSEICSQVQLIVSKIDSLAKQRANLGLEITSAMRPATRSSTMVKKTVLDTHSHVVPSEVFGRKADVDKIVESLVSDDRDQHPLSVLPIVGLGGLGKTTLAKMVYNDPRVERSFGLLMWVSVNGDFNTKSIARTMTEIAGGSGFVVSDMDSLQRSLKEAIRVRKYLLVLDDVWENGLRWEELEVLLKFGAHGSAVVVTTRSGRVADAVRTLDAHQLAELSEDDSWRIFEQEAFNGGSDGSSELVAIGREIVRKCGGLPLAARALGSMMRHKVEEEEWKEVAESEIWDLTVGQDRIFSALRLSYSDLSSHLKQCFAYCALFPKKYEIEKEVLINLWIANGLIPSDDTRNLQSKANTFYKELVQRSFFQNVKKGRRSGSGRMATTCQMHDLMRDLARMIIGSQSSSCTPLPSSSKGIKLRHLLKSDDGDLAALGPDALKTLRTLVLWRSADLSTSIGSVIVYLRALGVQNMGISEFPIKICNLRLLQFLDLSRNTFHTLPEEIGMLVNMRTLDLSACESLVELPKSIAYMSSLQNIYLEDCKSLRCMPSGMGKLRDLQTLTRYVVGSGGVSGGIEELRDMDLHGMLQLSGLENVMDHVNAEEANLGFKRNLEQLVLEWADPASSSDHDVAPPTMCLGLWRLLETFCLPTPDQVSAETGDAIKSHDPEAVLRALQPNRSLKELAIHGYPGITYPAWLMRSSMPLLQNLMEITLSDCSRCEHLPHLWRLPALETLEMRGMESVKRISGAEFYGGSDHDTSAFPKLRKLKLHQMRGLQEWLSIEAGRSVFPSIVEIEVSHCPVLTTMPAFPSVIDLRVTECPLLRPKRGFFETMASLETLGLVSCQMLTLLLEEEQPAGRTSCALRNLRVENCHQLMLRPPSYGMWNQMGLLENLEIIQCYGLYVLPTQVLRGLSRLKRLQIHWCKNLTSTSFSTTQVGFQYLTAIETVDLQVNPGFPRFHEAGLLRLPVLRTLYLYSNHGLTVLPEFSSSLRELVIYNCWNLRELPEGLGRLPNLDYLLLLALNRVTSLPEAIEGYRALKMFKVEECAGIVSFPLGLQRRLPSLQYLEVLRSPGLERKCANGGEYWPLIADIPRRYIGVFNPERAHKFTYISYN